MYSSEILNCITKPVLLLGDSCIDKFVYCDCIRLCPEAPVPLLDVHNITTNKGMAGNVHENLKALLVQTTFLTNSNFKRTIKTRYVDNKTNHMFIRIDHTEAPASTFSDYKNNIQLKDYSAVVMSDYNKGFLTEEDIAYICKKHPTTFLDTKKQLGSWCEDVLFIKINRPEYAKTESTIPKSMQRRIIVTCGGTGATYRNRLYPVKNVEVKDVSGAGDSFLAGLVCKYIQSASNIDSSIVFANKCASYVVQRKGVTVVERNAI